MLWAHTFDVLAGLMPRSKPDMSVHIPVGKHMRL